MGNCVRWLACSGVMPDEQPGHLLLCAAVDSFEDMVATQNAEMQPLHLQIRMLRHPQDKQWYIGLVNTASTDVL